MNTNNIRQRASVAVLTMLLAGCASRGGTTGQPPTQTGQSRRVALNPLHQPEAGLTPAQQAMLDDNCPFGAPEKARPEEVFWEHGPTHFVFREGYVLEHSDIDKIALWVCERVTAEEAAGSLPRPNSSAFRPDPQLDSHPRAERADYKGSGFDRGHLAPAGNQNSSELQKKETFFLSNIAPQVGPRFNQSVWKALEELTRNWAIERGSAFIITGTMFYDPEEEDHTTADGLIEYSTIGAGGVAVPTHFYKIVAAQNQDDEWEAIAFVMENRQYTGPQDFDEYIVAIDWIEERTALDFFPDMDPIDERSLEQDPAPLWE